MQFLQRIEHRERTVLAQHVGRMRTVRDRHRRGAGRCGHLQVMCGVADHHHPRRLGTQHPGQIEQHFRVRFGLGLIGAATGIELRSQPQTVQSAVQSGARLAGGDRQPLSAGAQLPEQLARMGKQLQTALAWRLRTYARRPSVSTVTRRLLAALAARMGLQAEWKRGPGKRLAAGGAVIGLVGADGAGKSTSARALDDWLAAELLARRVHLGRPPRALATLLAGGALKASRWLDGMLGWPSPSAVTVHLELLRAVATARDRMRLSRRMRRFALSGGVVLCDRYPVPEAYALAGPSAAQGIAASARGRLATLCARRQSAHVLRVARFQGKVRSVAL